MGEGRYSTFNLYHVYFLLHLDCILKMNMPFTFLKSLTKMVARVTDFQNIQHNIYHHDLINLLIVQELNKFNKRWDHFLL